MFLRVLVHWAGEDVPKEAPEDWDGTLARWERWCVARFPDFQTSEVDDSRRPSLSFERTLFYL